MNSGIIIIAWRSSNDNEVHIHALSNAPFVRLAPKSLQQQAIQKNLIYHHLDELPWTLLPKSLKSRFLFPAVDDNADE